MLTNESREGAQANARKNLARAQRAIPAWLDKRDDKIGKTLRKLSDPLERLRALLKLASDLTDSISSFTPCKKGCSFCCRMPTIELSELEAAEISRQTGVPISESPPRDHAWKPCPFLKDDSCTIYEHRPFFCRTHVVFSKTPTWCAPDKCNQFDFPLIRFPNLIEAYRELNKGKVRDIRETFPRHT